ncbi:MAG TPA: UbiH/UbiF family hydroxylase [Xanthobacteraceae bacterium]|nr:UbiH/UbiF family hydroxylase [Xanthobacteraceae bacterium]
MDTVEVAVVGGGPAGLTAAVALARAGVDTALISKRPPDDQRTTALLLGSVTALETLGVWPRCKADAAPLRSMRIVDDTRRLLRAPELVFAAAEIGLEAFGYNIANKHLLAALDAEAAQFAGLARVESTAQALVISADRVTIRLADGGAISARLVVGADGRNSLCRAAAGIDSDRHALAQTALTFNLGHARPHNDISTEFHATAGPFTLVPLPGRRSSLVFVSDPATAGAVAALDDAALAEDLERRAHSILGAMTVEPGRGLFPLAAQIARYFAADRIALVGEAAHVLPPIGAQGLNLGLRDAAAIAEIVAEAKRAGGDVGDPGLLARYDRMRRPDIASRALAVDLLNRTLLSDFLPLQAGRQLGFWLAECVGPLRRALMREGVAPAFWQPRLMRGEGL